MFNLIIFYSNDRHCNFKEISGSGYLDISYSTGESQTSMANENLPSHREVINSIEKNPVIIIKSRGGPYLSSESKSMTKVSLWCGRIKVEEWGGILNGNETSFYFIKEEIEGYGPEYIDREVTSEVLHSLGNGGYERNSLRIMDENVNEIFSKLDINADKVDSSGRKKKAFHARKKGNKPIEDIKDYLEEVLKTSQLPGEECFYRGHSDQSYQLEPSLFRKHEDRKTFHYRRYESEMITELLTAQPDEFTDDRYMLDKLVRMQHYGLPTRLLDVSTNPLIALYFACSGKKKNKRGKEIDGSVIIITTKSNDVKFFDSDTVSCISNISRLPDKLKIKLHSGIPRNEFCESDVGAQLLHQIRNEKPYFQQIINPLDLNRIVLVKGRLSNTRISSQSGAFLLFGDEVSLPENGNNEFQVRKLIIRNKEHLMDQLDKLGINESTVFPGIEKAAGEIARKYDRRK